MARSKSSGRWLQEHFEDDFVARAKREGYRSRAVYKLKEIDEKSSLFSPGMTVVDLGSAPGGWSQFAAQQVGPEGKVVACDLLPMDPVEGVTFIEGDFSECTILDAILTVLSSDGADVVISDMAPNMSGVGAVDLPRAYHLCDLALELACDVLKPRGSFLIKVFHGQGFDNYISELRKRFTKVVSRKPSASRSRSREAYLLAQGLKL
ncbi:MAG: 23S rRNA (uridine(2552)-2'-O)-methyltransferase RlmE [Pseudomonadota bacterium]